MDSTRRSSRARASQPPKSESHHSSTSSNSSSRGDRTTRSHKISNSPRKSTPPNSLSSESAEETITALGDDTSQTRRKRAGGGMAEIKLRKQEIEVDTAIEDEEEAGDDEEVRCICEFEDYPGPPQLGEDNKHGIKDGIEEPPVTVADLTEDLAGFFLQCDSCKVWQHGGCVGIMNAGTSPEEYFCERCRKDLHRICTAINGQKYSYYLPLHESVSRNASRAPSYPKAGTRSPQGSSKNGRPSSSMHGSKRRSTMNSRDAAYDEEEQIRRAIEASKGEESVDNYDSAIRRGKRGRSDSVEKPEGPKRQRTASSSPSPIPIPRQATHAESDDGEKIKNTATKKFRGAAARNHREKEMKEERERSRQEAASKRKGRAERRRAEDSDPSDDIPLAEKAAAKSATAKTAETTSQPLEAPSSQISPDTPPTNPSNTSQKKGGRPPNARKGKLGRNQYTKDRDLEGSDRSPNRSQSRDVRDDGSNTHRPNNDNKAGKLKPSPSSKVTINDMRKRVASILDYIQRTQIDMADGSSASSPNGSTTGRLLASLAEDLPMVRFNGESSIDGDEYMRQGSTKKFKDLTVPEMMDVLTTQLVKWQQEFT